jgi:hypothetical protein
MQKNYAVCLIAAVLSLAALPASAQYILTNGDAEAGDTSPDGTTSVSIPGWTIVGTATVVEYGAPGTFPDASHIPSDDTGDQLFVGGPGQGISSLIQVLHIPEEMWVDIDSNPNFWHAWVQAFLGGWEADEDSARLVVSFLDETMNLIDSFTLGPVTAADRSHATGLQYCTHDETIPAGARHLEFVLELTNVKVGTTGRLLTTSVLIFSIPILSCR